MRAISRSRVVTRMFLIGAASAMLVLSRPAVADQVSFFSTGAGKQTCANYLQASQGLQPNDLRYNQKPERTFVSDNAIYDHWIFGFLSAMNLASAANGQSKPDIQVRNIEIIGWVRNWCAAHPDAPMFEGAYSFVKDQWSRRGAN